MFIGRYQLREEVPVEVITRNASDTASIPDDVPVVDIFNAAGAKIKQVKLPVLDRFGQTGLFGLRMFLDVIWATGFYNAVVMWNVGAYTGIEVVTFEIVAGGDPDGAVISLYNYDRPHGRFLIQQLDSGRIAKGRNPRI